jgi:hypothetical protein
MPHAEDTPTLALVVYGDLWNESCKCHPRVVPGYCWKSHLRCLCKLARALHEEQPIALRVAGEAEKLQVWALADVNPELLILDIVRDRASRPGLPAFVLWFLDPTDAHLKSVPARQQAVGRQPPGNYI